MLLRLLRSRSWWPGRGRSRPDAAASRAAANQAGARQTRQLSGPPGSHRKTRASGTAGRQRNGTGSDRSAPDGAGPAAPIAVAGLGATAPASAGRPAPRAGAHRATRTAVTGTAPNGTAPSGTVPSNSLSNGAAARVAIRLAPDMAGAEQAADVASPARPPAARSSATAGNGQPWYETSLSGRADLGLRDCGCLEQVLIREWGADEVPAPETVTAINRLAGLPQLIKEKLAAGLDAIHVGDGGVPDLDHMGELKGVLLPSGRATWDACAGAYGDRKIVVGSRPSPTPDVVCHEVGHALDDIDGADGTWQSDAAAFAAVYDRCFPHFASEFHSRHGASSRREFFADAFAAIASAQRPALVEMLSGNTRSALDVMLYFNVRYGI